MSTQIRRWHLYESRDELEQFAARAILRAAAEAIETEGRFRIVLAGGQTPRSIYARLANASSQWDRWHLYFGDERCRPAGDAVRNDRMAREVWLAHVPIPRAQIHPIPAELGPEEGARRYAEVLAPLDRFDLVLLGLGEDGHTAGLFPGDDRHSDDVVPVRGAPKPPAERVSLGAGRLGRARQVMFVAAGEGKRRAVAAWRRGDAIPAARIVPASGVDILLDSSAWPDRFA